MKKEIVFYPAWDKRSKDPKKNYGIHCVEFAFYLKGELGCVQFKTMTGWYPDHCEVCPLTAKPMPSDLGYHSPRPMYDGQKVIEGSCEFLDGKPCYYDGSSLNAIRVFGILKEKGSEGVWSELEDFYKSTFGELK